LLNAQKGFIESAVRKGFMDAAELSAFGWEKKEIVATEPPGKVKKEKVIKEPTPVTISAKEDLQELVAAPVKLIQNKEVADARNLMSSLLLQGLRKLMGSLDWR